MKFLLPIKVFVTVNFFIWIKYFRFLLSVYFVSWMMFNSKWKTLTILGGRWIEKLPTVSRQRKADSHKNWWMNYWERQWVYSHHRKPLTSDDDPIKYSLLVSLSRYVSRWFTANILAHSSRKRVNEQKNQLHKTPNKLWCVYGVCFQIALRISRSSCCDLKANTAF